MAEKLSEMLATVVAKHASPVLSEETRNPAWSYASVSPSFGLEDADLVALRAHI